MREIKFRAWDKHMEEFRFIFSVYGLSHWHWKPSEGPDENLSNFGWEQYTGRNDYKGRQVYEGDIVNIIDESRHIEKLLVKWSDEKAGFVMENAEWKIGFWNIEHIEITGNIHAHPELMGVEK